MWQLVQPYARFMELEVRHLRALCAIADTGSLHKAARQLGVSQPSLTTQLQRIENSLGAELFSRDRTGCRPTPLGRSVLSRARPLVAEMTALVVEAKAAAARAGGPRLRVGSTASRVLAGWLRRLRQRLPGTDISLHVDVSANALLRMVAAGQLDIAFVHEVEGCPLLVPDSLAARVLLDREPQFVSMARDHPAAAAPVVELADLAEDRWMVDPTVDGEWDGLRRVLLAAGLNPGPARGLPHRRIPDRDRRGGRAVPADLRPARGHGDTAAARRPARGTAAAVLQTRGVRGAVRGGVRGS